MKTTFKNAILGTALAATAAAGVMAGAAPAAAHEWGHRGGGGAGVAVAAGLIGLVAGVAIASDHDRDRDRYVGPPPVYYEPRQVAYVEDNGCYSAYPGYDGTCYPASYYVNLGWGRHDGGWWYGGARYARPFVVGGYRGGYTQYRGYDNRGYGWQGQRGGEYRGHDGDRRGYDHGGENRGNWGGGRDHDRR